MNHTARTFTAALALIAVVLVAAAPAAAASPAGRASDGAVDALPLAGSIHGWAAGWLAARADDAPLQRVTAAAAGPGLDPSGADDPEPDGGGGPTTQGGPTIDPDG